MKNSGFFSRIEDFLINSKYEKENIFKNEHLNLLENLKKNFNEIFERDPKISSTEISVKYSELIKCLTKNFEIEIKINDLFTEFIDLTEMTTLTMNLFLNYLIILCYILELKDLFKINIEYIKNLIDFINIIEIDGISNEKNKIFEKIRNSNSIYKNVFVFIYIISFCGLLNFDENNFVDNFFINFSYSNKIYFNDKKISFINFIENIILINIFIINLYDNNNYNINKKRKKSNEFNNNILENNKKKSNYKSNTNLMGNINKDFNLNNIFNFQNFYLIDNEFIPFNNKEMENQINLIKFQNYLKFYLFDFLSINTNNNSNKFYINLIIMNFKNLLNSNKIFEKFPENDSNNLNLSNLSLFLKEDINLHFKSFIFDDFILKIKGFNTIEQIKEYFYVYEDLINRSKNFYIQEPLNEDEYFSIDFLFLEWSILENFLMFLCKKKESKILSNIFIRINFIKFTLKKTNKEINLFFNYSNIKEKILFNFFKKNSNLNYFIDKTMLIIDTLNSFKYENISIRIFQNNFRSKQIQIYLKIIIKTIINNIEEINYKNFKVLEKNFENYNKNFQCFISNKVSKKKLNYFKFKNFTKKLSNFYQFKFLSNYQNELIENFDLIVASDNENDFNLLRTFEDNKIFFFLSKNNLKEDLPLIKVIIYFSNSRLIYENGMNLINSLVTDKINELDLQITVICDRFFLESNFLMEPHLKKQTKILYNYVDNIYLIAKNISNENENKKEKKNNKNEENNKNENDFNEFNSEDVDEIDEENILSINNKEYFNYDIYISDSDSFISIINYHLYEIKKDKNYHKLVYEFISILSSCIELVLYILKNKDLYLPRFIYILKTFQNLFYTFEYKMSNIFIKRINNFDSLINYKKKKTIPLLAILSKKVATNYTLSNDNFYDLFLRLFLNLNKVVDSQKTLNMVFFQKIHKNIFYEYYDSFIPIAFSYESFILFNKIFLTNNYIEISKNEKFEKFYLIPLNSFKKNFINIFINNNNEKEDENFLCKKIILINFDFTKGYEFKKKKYLIFSFHKIDNLIDEINNKCIKQRKKQINKSFFLLSKKFEKITKNKKIDIKKNLKKIYNFLIGNNNESLVEKYDLNLKEYENIIDNYNKEKIKIQTQKIEMRVFQLTEDAKNNIKQNKKNKNKDCVIF